VRVCVCVMMMMMRMRTVSKLPSFLPLYIY
jgi:hypothetical protein